MNKDLDIFLHSELSLAAYSNLWNGISGAVYIDELQNEGQGLSESQAIDFASTWNVVVQEALGFGLSVTIFEDIESKQKYLAIRGTEPGDIGDLITDYLILDGLPSQLNPQYIYLKAKVSEWTSDGGPLDTNFTVTGHSLGGYLAAGLVADFPDNITHAYLYNAPGNTNEFTELLGELGVINSPDGSKITEIQADAGTSLIAGLGIDYSSPLLVHIENQIFGGVSDWPISLNHSQRVLTDSLAVYSTFSKVSPSLTLDDITQIIKASTNENATTLESSVDKLASVFSPNHTPIEEGDRESLYQTITYIEDRLGLYFDLTILPIKQYSNESIILAAENSIAFRYALINLDPFVVTGDDALYAQHNADGELDLYNPETQTGAITEEYLKDRAILLQKLIDINVDDKGVYVSAEQEYFKDYDSGIVFSSGNVIGNDYPINIQKKYIFGGSEEDSFSGGDRNDRLYGGGGIDTIAGGAGDDYIEGNQYEKGDRFIF